LACAAIGVHYHTTHLVAEPQLDADLQGVRGFQCLRKRKEGVLKEYIASIGRAPATLCTSAMNTSS
jgi:hypothetical protein